MPEDWLALYDAHAEAIWQLVARLVGGQREEVADVIQETFLAAARSLGTFDPLRGSPRAWLCGIARRQVALYYRREERHRRLFEAEGPLAQVREQLAAWLDGEQVTPSDLLTRAETVEAIRVALSQLNDSYGEALTARYLEGQDIDSMARTEGCSESAIRSRLARARKAFRHVLLALSPSAVDTGDQQHA